MRDFKKYFLIRASPEEVYLALTLPETIQLWTSEVAEMNTEPESGFSLWEGSIMGKNLAFEKNRKLIQQWYFGDQECDSIVTIKLHPHKKYTSVELIHTNIPDEVYEEMVDGWNENYFGMLIQFYS